MKVSVLLSFLLASIAHAHYRFSRLYLGGVMESAEWTSVRTTRNWKEANPSYFTDANSTDIRCHQLPDKTTPGVTTATAGSNVGFVPYPTPVFHDGPFQFYMAKVPETKDVRSWEPDGDVWFKIGYGGHKVTHGDIEWPTLVPQKARIVNVTIPKEVPSGNYLLRIEQIGFNTADPHTFIRPPQWYVACAQMKIVNGGQGTPEPLVSFPGEYKPGQEGLNLSSFPIPTYYHPPGPPVWPSGATGRDGTPAGIPVAPF